MTANHLRARRGRGARVLESVGGALGLCLLLVCAPGAASSAMGAAGDPGGAHPAPRSMPVPMHVRVHGIAGESTGAEAPGYPWSWPVRGARTVVEPFRAPAHDYGPGHRGMDVLAAPGAAVRAPAAGVVAFRGTVVDRPLVTIDHGDGYMTTLEPVVSELAPGDAVAAGAAVGTVSTGGHAPRGSLHVGVRVDGSYVNPRGLFGAVPRAVLLPCCAN